jgi:LmbE family N-acetylglucosaminyl deacetylase
MAKVLMVGAHPDDCDLCAGGTAALWRARGDEVKFVSVTNGSAGHHLTSGQPLAARRREEARRAGAVLRIEYEVLDHADGCLEPTLACRLEMIRLIRRFKPDLVLTHRPWDYHPDHRYTSVLVQDSAYMVTVPAICPDVPSLATNPVLAYFHDDFRKPCSFQADVAVDVDSVMELKWEMIHAHTSQFYEWLPSTDGTAAEVPAANDDRARREWLRRRWSPRLEAVAGRHLEALAFTYGMDHASDVEFAEAFEISELGSRPAREALRKLFPLP